MDSGLTAWEKNAQFWDDYMGDESNYFHRDLVRPKVTKLLDIKKGDFVLDIACGNGNYSEYLAQKGAKVVAFDYSEKMIQLAVKRRQAFSDSIEFKVCNETQYDELLKLKRNTLYDKAIANMAIMDIADIRSLFSALNTLLRMDGVFVFVTHHPCFTYPDNDYFTHAIEKGEAIPKQPVLQNYYHRSVQEIFNIAFENGFVIDGFHEVPFEGEKVPIIMIVRLRKNN